MKQEGKFDKFAFFRKDTSARKGDDDTEAAVMRLKNAPLPWTMYAAPWPVTSLVASDSLENQRLNDNPTKEQAAERAKNSIALVSEPADVVVVTAAADATAPTPPTNMLNNDIPADTVKDIENGLLRYYDHLHQVYPSLDEYQCILADMLDVDESAVYRQWQHMKQEGQLDHFASFHSAATVVTTTIEALNNDTTTAAAATDATATATCLETVPLPSSHEPVSPPSASLAWLQTSDNPIFLEKVVPCQVEAEQDAKAMAQDKKRRKTDEQLSLPLSPPPPSLESIITATATGTTATIPAASVTPMVRTARTISIGLQSWRQHAMPRSSLFGETSSCTTRSNVPSRPSWFSSKSIASTGNPTVDDDHIVVRELKLDPDKYEIFQQDPYLFLGLDKRDESVELDIEVIDKRS